MSVRRVLTHLETSDPWTDSLGVELENALHWSSPFLSASGYESLKQAGVHRVSDERLRSAVVHLFENTYGSLVGDQDRMQWAFMASVIHPLYRDELIQSDSGHTESGTVSPIDIETTRRRGAVRTMLLEHESNLLFGIRWRRDARDETVDLIARLAELGGT